MLAGPCLASGTRRPASMIGKPPQTERSTQVKKFQVTFRRTVYAAMHVEAETAEEAVEIAQKRVDDADGEPKFDDDDFESGSWEQISDFGADEMETNDL